MEQVTGNLLLVVKECVTGKAKRVRGVLSEKVISKLRPEGWTTLEEELWEVFLGRKAVYSEALMGDLQT